MSTESWIICNVCGAREPAQWGYGGMEATNLDAEWRWHEGKDHCPTCAESLPPRVWNPNLTNVSAAYGNGKIYRLFPEVPVIKADGKDIYYRFVREKD